MSAGRSSAARALLAIALILCVAVTVGATMLQRRESVQFNVYPLRYASPEEARRMLRDLLGEEAQKTQVIADTDSRQLLVRGSSSALELAADLIKRLDTPPVRTPPTRPLPKVVRTYQVANVSAVAARLRADFGKQITVTEASTDSIMVRATESTHRAVSHLLAVPPDRQIAPADVRPVRQPTTPAPLTPRESIMGTWLPGQTESQPSVRRPEQPAGQSSVDVWFRTKTGSAVESASRRLFGNRLVADTNGRYGFRTRDGRVATLQFMQDRHGCRVSGPTPLVQQFTSLLRRLDTMPRDEMQHTRFIRVRHVDPRTIKQTIRALQNSQLRPSDSRNELPLPAGAPQGRGLEPNDDQAAADFTPRATIRLASYQQQTEPGTAATDNRQDPDPQTQLRRPASDLEIESLPDLDVIILRGRDPDVEELTRIIREIERIAETTAPEIHIYPLQHVRGEAMDELVDSVLDDLTGTLQGRVTITPLIKPNALLLIGWGEAVNAVKDLIAKLDRPVPATTQLRIYALKHAAAAQVQTTIQQFLSDRGGLSPNVITTADTRTNTLIVNASPRDLQEIEILVRRLDSVTSDAVNRGRMIRLKNSLAPDMASTVQAAIEAARGGNADGRSAVLEMILDGPDGQRVLKSGLLDDVRVTADVRSNTLVLTGPAESVGLIEELIARLDAAAVSAAVLKVFPIENGDAGEMVLVLRSLFPAAAANSTVPQLPTTATETTLVPVRFSVDARTNTVIATGSSGDLEVVEALIRRLDLDGAQERINKVYRLENSPAIDVAQAVNEFLRSERIVQQAAPGRLNAFQQIESEVVVVPEPVGNSLIISATPRFYDEIVDLVESLDEQPPQVLIQVVLAEVELGDLHEFGVELGLQDSLLFDRGLLGDLLTTTNSTATSTPAGVVTETMEIIRAASLTPGFDFNNNPLGNSGSDLSVGTAARTAGQALSHFSLGRTNGDLAYGGLVLSASSENVSVLIRALNQSGRFEVLSRPQIMTLDNQPASILVGQRVPRVVGTSINQVGQVNQVELEDVGLILGVTPRISPDGMVVMEVDAEKSEIGRVEDGIPVSVSAQGQVVRSPSVNITRAQTTVSAASGQTIVIGGLITTSDRSITRAVPWLSEIPWLGELFRYDAYDTERKELLIILTPRVIRNRADAEHIKQLEMARISWSSSDAFDWTSEDVMPPSSGQLDASGVPVIYPDATPGLEWADANGASDENTWQVLPLPEENELPQSPPSPADSEADLFRTGTTSKPNRRTANDRPANGKRLWPFQRGGAR